MSGPLINVCQAGAASILLFFCLVSPHAISEVYKTAAQATSIGSCRGFEKTMARTCHAGQIKDPVVTFGENQYGATCSIRDCHVCARGGVYLGKGFCMLNERCPEPYTYNLENNMCEAHCPESAAWNSALQRCEPKPEEESCETQGKNPIDYLSGRKYRSESIIMAGNRFPFTLIYYYSNLGNNTKTAGGSIISHNDLPHTVVAARQPVPFDEYQSLYNEKGLPKVAPYVHVGQHYGSIEQYWRHSFDEVLQIQNNQYIFHTAKGQMISFTGLGLSLAYPDLTLEMLPLGEEVFNGFKVTDAQTSTIKKFDDTGKLRIVKRGSDDILFLSYDTQNKLEKVVNTEGEELTFVYQHLPKDSMYSTTASDHYYPVMVTASNGLSAKLQWDRAYRNKTSTQYLLTGIIEQSSGVPTNARRFAYNDHRWFVSLTDIYYQADFVSATEKLFAHFEYDEFGRAIYSSLANGVNAESVQYVNDDARIITNALGKQATYLFQDFDGVKRLKKVTGEPTQNCLKTEVEYNYDSNGNVQQIVANGILTQFSFDSQNREISRTEAFGAPEARTITTEWHPQFHRKTRVVEGGRETLYTYDNKGRLLSTTTNPLPIQ